MLNLVLFDEGHSEPARTWAKAVRDLQKKLILFTATPYRNDYRRFNVEEQFTYRFHYDQAEQENIIRKVDLQFYNDAFLIRQFADGLLALLNTVSAQYEYARVLVRCPSATDIAQLVTHLNRLRPGSAMGFHTAVDESEFLKRRIPDLHKIDEAVKFFVHEKLLLQKVDEKRSSRNSISEHWIAMIENPSPRMRPLRCKVLNGLR